MLWTDRQTQETRTWVKDWGKKNTWMNQQGHKCLMNQSQWQVKSIVILIPVVCYLFMQVRGLVTYSFKQAHAHVGYFQT
jgi:hypothetical protein